MKKVQLEIRDADNNFVRSHSFFFNETEGQNYSITIDKQTYQIDSEGHILPTPNPKFTPYD